METPIITPTKTDAASERIRGLNERILEAGKGVGSAYLTAYEKTLTSIADQQDKAAEQTSEVEWLSSVIDAQARFTRDMSKLYVSAGRDLLK